MKIWWRVCGRFYALRHRRALAAASVFKARSEKFFQHIKGL